MIKRRFFVKLSLFACLLICNCCSLFQVTEDPFQELVDKSRKIVSDPPKDGLGLVLAGLSILSSLGACCWYFYRRQSRESKLNKEIAKAFTYNQKEDI